MNKLLSELLLEFVPESLSVSIRSTTDEALCAEALLADVLCIELLMQQREGGGQARATCYCFLLLPRMWSWRAWEIMPWENGHVNEISENR